MTEEEYRPLEGEFEETAESELPPEDMDRETEGDARPEDDDGPDRELPAEIKKTNLIFGVILATLGLIGIASLRTGIVQTMLGHQDFSSGIGDQEIMGIGISLVPFAIGIVLIGMWGVKNDPIYRRLEKLREEGQEPESEDEVEDLDLEEPELEDLEVPDEFSEPVEELEEEEMPRAEVLTTAKVQERIAEEMRVERCTNILSAVVILPEDKARLKNLIPTGISAEDFTEEIKVAVQRRKKKEMAHDVTADEKAAILEDELVAELDNLDKDINKDSDLEEDILKELDDLSDI